MNFVKNAILKILALTPPSAAGPRPAALSSLRSLLNSTFMWHFSTSFRGLVIRVKTTFMWKLCLQVSEWVVSPEVGK